MNKKQNRTEIESALKIIAKTGENVVHDADENAQIGWYDLNIGDTVYFKTFDDVNDVLTISKGEIIEIISSEKKVMNKPDSNMKTDGWHRERTITYRVRWNGMTASIDSRYVFTDKLDATLAAICETAKTYFIM